MKFRKLQISALTAVALSIPSFGESLYDLASLGEDSDSPFSYFAGVNAGWDDNVLASSSDEEDSIYVEPYVGVAIGNATPQTTWNLYARLGVIYYLDDITGADDDYYSSSRLGFNFTHRFSERLRFTSRNFISYELEPDYDTGISNTRAVDEYFYASTDNSFGYRWTQRFATYLGIRANYLNYEGDSPDDRSTFEPYVQGRYQLTPQTVLTAGYRYRDSQAENSGLGVDSTSHIVTGGVEHRFSPNTIGTLRVGAQFRDVDDRGDSTSPYVEGALRSRVNDQFAVRSYVRYSIEDYGAVAGTDEVTTLRLGVSGDYSISPRLTLNGGVTYIMQTFEDTVASGDIDQDIINLYAGFGLKLTDNVSLNGRYVFTTVDSDVSARDYDRNRLNVGIEANF